MKEEDVTIFKAQKDETLVITDLNVQDKDLFGHFMAISIDFKVVFDQHSLHY